jgi:hypothetical protein
MLGLATTIGPSLHQDSRQLRHDAAGGAPARHDDRRSRRRREIAAPLLPAALEPPLLCTLATDKERSSAAIQDHIGLEAPQRTVADLAAIGLLVLAGRLGRGMRGER